MPLQPVRGLVAVGPATGSALSGHTPPSSTARGSNLRTTTPTPSFCAKPSALASPNVQGPSRARAWTRSSTAADVVRDTCTRPTGPRPSRSVPAAPRSRSARRQRHSAPALHPLRSSRALGAMRSADTGRRTPGRVRRPEAQHPARAGTRSGAAGRDTRRAVASRRLAACRRRCRCLTVVRLLAPTWPPTATELQRRPKPPRSVG